MSQVNMSVKEIIDALADQNYEGPRAGKALDQEWLAVTDWQAFKWLRSGTWNYSDFDCWLVARDRNK